MRSLAYFTPPKHKLVKTREQELFPSPRAQYLGSALRDAILTVRCSGVVSPGRVVDHPKPLPYTFNPISRINSTPLLFIATPSRSVKSNRISPSTISS
jgi:hypothetical protein